MVKLIGTLSRLGSIKALVIGDFVLDGYISGKVERISPEAPVAVLRAYKEEHRPGGAGNVVLNLVSLGAQVYAVGRVGRDFAGEEIRSSLEQKQVNITGIAFQSRYKTPLKNRFIADSQHILRVDAEQFVPISEDLEDELIQKLPDLIEECEIVAVSDYGKGFLSHALLSVVIETAKIKQVPVIIDPKGADFTKYRGATILKPNLVEAYAATKHPLSCPLEEVASVILNTCGVEHLLITRSHEGISLFHRLGGRLDFPVRSKEVKDVTGAGDTVLAMLSVAIANGLDLKQACQLANVAAGLAIERVGCACITMPEIGERLMELDAENKVFDGEHLHVLKQSMQYERSVVLSLDSHLGMSTVVFKSLRKLSSLSSNCSLIVYVRDREPDREFISLLSSLKEVQFIVIDCDDIKDLCDFLEPEEIYLIEKHHLIHADSQTPI